MPLWSTVKERKIADFPKQDLSDALEKLCNTNKSIHPTQTFDINDPNTSNGNRNHFRSLAKFAHSDSHVYCALAAKNPCSIFPAVATWIKHESAYYHSLAILYQAHASWLAFDKNNTMSKVGPNEIDLHDQHLNDANQILANWMKEGKRNGEDHLHVITGSGKHSHDGAVLKPHVINVCSALKLKFEPESNQGRIRIQFSDAASIRKCNNCGPDIVKTPTELERHEAREFGREIRNGERATGNQQENHQATPGSTFGGPHPHQNNQQRGGSSSTRFAQYQAPVGNRTTLPQAPSSNTTGHHQAPINNTTASPQPPPIHTTTPPHPLHATLPPLEKTAPSPFAPSPTASSRSTSQATQPTTPLSRTRTVKTRETISAPSAGQANPACHASAAYPKSWTPRSTRPAAFREGD